MNPLKKVLAITVLGGLSAGAWLAGSSLFDNVKFARAQDQVEEARATLGKAEDLSAAYRQVGKVVEPSVVKIDVKKTVRGGDARNPFQRFFFDRDGDGMPDEMNPDEEGNDEGSQGPFLEGAGSGVIMAFESGYGYVLTNNHVAGSASEISVTLSDGRRIDDATLVGADPKTDLAVVKIKANHLIAARWGNSDYLEKGDIIMAFGSPFGYVGSMTHGIVSALNRDRVGIIQAGQFSYENFIQVDAPINPGNSGGPLVNLRGEVVGINTAIATRTGSFSGIGFAIPANMAKNVYEQLKSSGKVTRGWLGVEIADVTDPRVARVIQSTKYEGTSGAFIMGVRKNVPASGVLEAGDVVVSVNGKKLERSRDLRNTIAAVAPGAEVTLSVVRQGKEQELKITVAEQPERLGAVAADSGQRPPKPPGEAAEETDVRDRLGIRIATPNEAQLRQFGLGETKEGALVTHVAASSTGQLSGLSRGDLIVKIGDEAVATAEEATAALGKADLTKGVGVTIVNREGSRFVFIQSR